MTLSSILRTVAYEIPTIRPGCHRVTIKNSTDSLYHTVSTFADDVDFPNQTPKVITYQYTHRNKLRTPTETFTIYTNHHHCYHYFLIELSHDAMMISNVNTSRPSMKRRSTHGGSSCASCYCFPCSVSAPRPKMAL
jgi:hypothetical protein